MERPAGIHLDGGRARPTDEGRRVVVHERGVAEEGAVRRVGQHRVDAGRREHRTRLVGGSPGVHGHPRAPGALHREKGLDGVHPVLVPEPDRPPTQPALVQRRGEALHAALQLLAGAAGAGRVEQEGPGAGGPERVPRRRAGDHGAQAATMSLVSRSRSAALWTLAPPRTVGSSATTTTRAGR